MNKRLLQSSGRELLKGNFGNAFKSFVGSMVEIDPSSYRMAGAGAFFMTVDCMERYFDFTGVASAYKAYTQCSPISSIINRIALSMTNGKTWIMNIGGRGIGAEATNDAATRIRTLLAKPNPFQTGTAFEAQIAIYTALFGYCIILPIKPAGFSENIYSTRLWVIPPTMIQIEELNEMFIHSKLLDRITITYKGEVAQLRTEDILIIRDAIATNFNSMLFPDSRLQPLQQEINNIIGAYESRSVLINQRGPLSIISSGKTDDSGTVAFTPEENEEIRKELQKYGLRKGQIKHIVTNAKLEVVSVGYPTKELMLFEEIEDDICRICDAYNFPQRLVAFQRGQSGGVGLGGDSAGYNADKMLYQNAVIPLANNIYEHFNSWFETPTYKIRIEKDFSHVAALQEDKKFAADAHRLTSMACEIDFRNGVITLNQWRERIDVDTTEDGDVYYWQMMAEGKTVSSINVNNSLENGNSQQ